VDRARAIGGQMGDPAALTRAVHDAQSAVFDEVRAVEQHNARIAFFGLGNFRAEASTAFLRPPARTGAGADWDQ